MFLAAAFALVCFDPYSSVSSDMGEMDIQLNGPIMSAQIQGASFRVVLEKLKKDRDIWFVGNEFLLDQEVTVYFKNLPFNEGINRILFKINHAQIFKSKEKLGGVLLIGKKRSENKFNLSAERTINEFRKTTTFGSGNHLWDQTDKFAQDTFFLEEPVLFKMEKNRHNTSSELNDFKPKDPFFPNTFNTGEKPTGDPWAE
jgi:hypothetical protein